MIIGHKNPGYLIDTADSIKYYNKGNYEIVFAIDNNLEAYAALAAKYGQDRVFVTAHSNGWGRGILRTIIYALDYFETRIPYHHVITIDSDALCVGPFVNAMVKKAEQPNVFFVGSIWHSPSKDHGYHRTLRASGFMGDYPYKFITEMAAGPCMMWTNHCFKFFRHIGLMPASKFDDKYKFIHFAHDQISTYLRSCGVCEIEDIGHLMEIKWRQSLPTFNVPLWGDVPITHPHTAIIHPTESYVYTEDNCRGYFKSKRTQTML